MFIVHRGTSYYPCLRLLGRLDQHRPDLGPIKRTSRGRGLEVNVTSVLGHTGLRVRAKIHPRTQYDHLEWYMLRAYLLDGLRRTSDSARSGMAFDRVLSDRPGWALTRGDGRQFSYLGL